MSGPKTTSYRFSVEYQREVARRREEERRRREAHAKRLASAVAQCDRLDKRTQRLRSSLQELKQRFPSETSTVVLSEPSRPGSDDPERLELYAKELALELDRASSALQLAQMQAQANEDFRKVAGAITDLDKGNKQTAEAAITAFLETKTLAISVETRRQRLTTVERVLGRLANEGWSEVPSAIERIALEVVSAESDGRAEALITELRFTVQKLNQERTEQEREQKEARSMLDQLELEIPLGEDRLKQALELVVAGAAALNHELRASVLAATESAEKIRQADVQTTAGQIIEGTLKDLGYQVGTIESTLFMKGGTAYFKKAGWDDYCVRLAVRPNENRMNFNVVRMAATGGKQFFPNHTRDVEVENDWCSEFPRLMNTLRARGLESDLVRHVAPGKIPVPVVAVDETISSLVPEERVKMKVAPSVAQLKPDKS